MKTIRIKKQPSIPEILRSMGVGESRRIALVGSAYNSVHTAMTRLRRQNLDFSYIVTSNVMTITRTK